MTNNQLMCDNHPDRPAVTKYGNESSRGDGSFYFKVSHKFCEECDKEFRKGKMFIERT